MAGENTSNLSHSSIIWATAATGGQKWGHGPTFLQGSVFFLQIVHLLPWAIYLAIKTRYSDCIYNTRLILILALHNICSLCVQFGVFIFFPLFSSQNFFFIILPPLAAKYAINSTKTIIFNEDSNHPRPKAFFNHILDKVLLVALKSFTILPRPFLSRNFPTLWWPLL